MGFLTSRLTEGMRPARCKVIEVPVLGVEGPLGAASRRKWVWTEPIGLDKIQQVGKYGSLTLFL